MIALICLISIISLYHIPNDYIYGIVFESTFALLCLSVFLKTHYSKYFEKSLWFCFFILNIINLLFFSWYDEQMSLSFEVITFETLAFISMYLYSQYRNYDIQSDEYNKKDTFIILKRPDNFKEYLISCVLVPVSSMSVVSKGKWYRFKRGESFTMANYTEDDRHIYIKVDIKDVNKKLKPFLGNEWTRKQNCCHVIQELFSIKFSKLDSIPAYMAHKIIKIRG